MKLELAELQQHLKGTLAPIYLLSGEEPLQQMEAADAIRAAAMAQGCEEREVFHVEKGFDWGQLTALSQAMSLFAQRRLIELRMSGKPGDSGSKALQAYAESPSPDDILLIVCDKLDSSQQRSKWVKALLAKGVHIPVWPLKAAQMPAWIQRRMKTKGLQAPAEAVSMLVDRVEGNLLAAEQEMEKLVLLYGEGTISLEQITEAVADSARFDIFALVDAALAGDAGRCLRMLNGVRAEGVEAILVLWALTREIRSLMAMATVMEQGRSAEQVMAEYRVWANRKALVRQGLQRHNRKRWEQILRRAARIDTVIKGAAGNAWDELLQLLMLMAGRRLFRVPPV